MSAEPPAKTITYLLTDFPAVSHTFISGEIAALEALGQPVHIVALNPADRSPLVHADDVAWQRRTEYVKSTSKIVVAARFARVALRHPSIVLIPKRLVGGDLKLFLWRLFYLVEAVLLADSMHRHHSRHVHAHFGQAPATVAWFATEVGSRAWPDEGPWTWSMTIHGWHEFVNERSANLREKTAAASLVVCVSDFTRSQLYRIADPADWDKLQVVRCGIDLTKFTRRADQPCGQPPRILMVARLSPEKGHLIMLQALRLLHDRGIAATVDLVGPSQAGFERFIREASVRLDLVDSVRFRGSVGAGQIAEYLDEVDVFCLPTFAEGLPVVIMEAMARGVPVATTYISGIPELAIDGETAVVVPAGRSDLLADELERLFTDPALCKRLVANAADRVSAEHDIVKNVVELGKYFDELVQCSSRSTRLVSQEDS